MIDRPAAKINGIDTYVSRDGTTPDKYRTGLLRVGWGNHHVGFNSDYLRHGIQNRLIHDQLPGSHHFAIKPFGINGYGRPSYFFGSLNNYSAW